MSEITSLVRVGKLGGKVEMFSFEGHSASLEDVLAMADLSTDGYRVTVNGHEVEDQMVNDRDVVMLIPKVKGGAS